MRRDHVMNEASQERLELFVEMAERLLSRRKLLSLIGIHQNVGEEKWQYHEEIEGFLLTFRLFLLHKEGIALYKAGLSSPEQLELLALTDVSERWKEKVRQACQSIGGDLRITCWVFREVDDSGMRSYRRGFGRNFKFLDPLLMLLHKGFTVNKQAVFINFAEDPTCFT